MTAFPELANVESLLGDFFRRATQFLIDAGAVRIEGDSVVCVDSLFLTWRKRAEGDLPIPLPPLIDRIVTGWDSEYEEEISHLDSRVAWMISGDASAALVRWRGPIPSFSVTVGGFEMVATNVVPFSSFVQVDHFQADGPIVRFREPPTRITRAEGSPAFADLFKRLPVMDAEQLQAAFFEGGVADDLLYAAKPAEIIDGIAFEGEPSLVHGPVKSGKSTVVIAAAARAVAAQKCKVIWFAFEGYKSTVARRNVAFATYGKPPHKNWFTVVDMESGGLDIGEFEGVGKPKFTEFVHNFSEFNRAAPASGGLTRPLVVVVDTVTAALGPLEFDYVRDPVKITRYVESIRRRYAFATVIIHHSNTAGEVAGIKGILQNPSVINRLTGVKEKDGIKSGAVMTELSRFGAGNVKIHDYSLIPVMNGESTVASLDGVQVLDPITREPVNMDKVESDDFMPAVASKPETGADTAAGKQEATERTKWTDTPSAHLTAESLNARIVESVFERLTEQGVEPGAAISESDLLQEVRTAAAIIRPELKGDTLRMTCKRLANRIRQEGGFTVPQATGEARG